MLSAFAVVAAIVPVSGVTPHAAASTITYLTDADAYVAANAPNSNYGTATRLQTRPDRKNQRYSYIHVTVPSLAGPVASATLMVYATTSSSSGYQVAPASNAWTETGITWRNKPARGKAVAKSGAMTAYAWTQVDVTSLVTGAGSYTFALLPNTADSNYYKSRETGTTTAPRLVVTTQDPTPVDPFILAAGDIACDPTDGNYNGGAGTTSYCHMRQTAALLSSSAAAILPLGDEAYEDGTLDKFQTSYDPTWGQFRSLEHPVPGNHEYLDGTADGYYAYFGAAAGDPSKGYYSYDIGSWHIIAINSECTHVGGCGSGSPEETWLRSDLAAHPASCTLVYWHEPRFTSGIDSSATTPQGFTTFWTDLYNAHVDVVLNGHIHNYERFAPMDVNGNVDSNGVREFVVGTGGKSLVAFNSAVWPSSQVRSSSTYGVLQLTLHSDSYDWRFLPESGGTFTDSGTSACH